jgi:hypothetical protein
VCLLSPDRPYVFHPDPKTFYLKIYDILEILSEVPQREPNGISSTAIESVFKTVNQYKFIIPITQTQ